MKKLLAVILSAVLMLSVCAFTEGPEAGTCYCLSGISLEESVNPEKTVTIDEDVTDPDTGEVLVPAGDYKVSSFTVDKELLIKILGNMTLNGEPIPNVEMLKDENTDAMLTGAIYEGQGDLQTSVGYMFITASDGEVEGYNGGYYSGAFCKNHEEEPNETREEARVRDSCGGAGGLPGRQRPGLHHGGGGQERLRRRLRAGLPHLRRLVRPPRISSAPTA